MKEILGVADDPPARRRWFHDDYFDLFVWQTTGEVTLKLVSAGATLLTVTLTVLPAA